MRVETQASVSISAPREHVFNVATSTETMSDVFDGHGPIPGIESVENLGGGPTELGTQRHIHNSDGSVMLEEMRAWEPPEHQAYEIVDGLKPPFSLLVRRGGGDWRFTSTDSGTDIVWKFYFELTTPLVYPIAKPLFGGPFQKALQRCLNNIKDRIESGG